MKYTPEMIPQFINQIEQASTEQEIAAACCKIKSAVIARYPKENSRRRPMSEIRKAVRERFPALGGKTEHEATPFPYFWTNRGKGNVSRWEHLAIKYLSEEWNTKAVDQAVDPAEIPAIEAVKPVAITVSTEATEVIETKGTDSPRQSLVTTLGLSEKELEGVQNAIANSGLSEVEWLKKAILGRAKQQAAIRKWQGDELATISSDKLMYDKYYRTNPNVCRELTSRAVKAIKDWNYQNPDNKLCVTNALISELTGNVPKAIAKVTQAMDLESYNHSHQLTSVKNRLVKQRLGIDSFTRIISVKDYLG